MDDKKKLRASELAKDIRSGMTDPKLMEKYELSAKGLSSAFQKLVDAGIVGKEELENRTSIYKDTIDIDESRFLDRCYAVFEVWVREASHPDNEGYVVDVNEQGLQVAGLRAAPREKKRYLIETDQFPGVTRIEFEAECRWSRSDGSDGEILSGFHITQIDQEGMAQLKKLITAVTLCD